MNKDYNGTIRALAIEVIREYVLEQPKNQSICKEVILQLLAVQRIWLSDTDIFELMMPILFGPDKIREAEVKFIMDDKYGLSEAVQIILGDKIETQEGEK